MTPCHSCVSLRVEAKRPRPRSWDRPALTLQVGRGRGESPPLCGGGGAGAASSGPGEFPPSWGLPVAPQLLSSVCFSCLLSEARHSGLGCLTGVTATCMRVYLVLLPGGARAASSYAAIFFTPSAAFFIIKILIIWLFSHCVGMGGSWGRCYKMMFYKDMGTLSPKRSFVPSLPLHWDSFAWVPF